MKRIIVVAVLILITTYCSTAQVSLGIKGGLNLSTVTGADAIIGAKRTPGLVAGLSFDISVPFLLSIQPEMLYSIKGFEADYSLTPTINAKATGTLSYLEIPVLLKFSLPVPVVKPSLYAGPAIGILLSAKTKVEAPGQPTTDTDIKSNTTSTDWGIVFGAGVSVAVLTVDVRYTIGLTTLDKAGTDKVYNSVLTFLVGIRM